MPKSERFYGMDMLRGVAALMVVLYHSGLGDGPDLAPGGYLAVDFFFILSGFVLAKAHEGQLRQSTGRVQFLIQRVLRLYPLYAFGSLLGVALVLAGVEHASALRTVGSIATGAIFLPYPRPGLLYPLNFVAWSLAMELLVNVAFAFGLARMTTRRLLVLIMAAACPIIAAAYLHGSLDVGVAWSTVLGGVARVFVGFPAGIVIYRIASTQSRSTHWSALLYVGALVIALALHINAAQRLALDLPFALLGAPALVYAAARVEVPNRLWAISKLFGTISYPLYAIHHQVLTAVANLLHPQSLTLWVVTVLALPGIAWTLARWYDRPVQKLLALYIPARSNAG